MKNVKKIVIAIILILLAYLAWDFRDGSFDTFRANNYTVLSPVVDILGFEVYVPAHVPKGFRFQAKESISLVSGNIGIPQLDLLYERSRGKDAFMYRQFDRAAYETAVVQNIPTITDFPSYFAYLQEYEDFTKVQQNDLTMYIKTPAEKAMSLLGEEQYTASGFLLRDDSLVQVIYSGDTPLSQEEVTATLLSLQPF